jgi:aminopeptidase N
MEERALFGWHCFATDRFPRYGSRLNEEVTMWSRLQQGCGMLSGILLAMSVFCLEVHEASADEVIKAAADRPVDLLHIRLDLDVSLKKQEIAGTATIDFQPNREITSFTLDAIDHEVLGIRRISPEGATTGSVKFENTGKQIKINFGKKIARGQKERIEISYRVRSPKSGLHFFRPTKSEPQTPWMVWSQGEPRANRYWFPCFDHPNERQTTEIIARVDKEFSVLSNGKLIERREIEKGKRVRYHWKQTKPHVSYLVTLVVGKFAIVQEKWRGRPITYYVQPSRKEDAKRTFKNTLEMMDFFSKRFGIEYPWEKYAQVVVEQFTSGGMENTSATTLYSGVMHDKRALLDSSPDRLIAHELGHQWWGDLVTCRDWSHLWLNEGFATYCEVLWYEHKLGRDERDYLLYQKSRSARSGTALKRPVVDHRYPAPRTMFDVRAYPKGGWVLHMLRSRLGDKSFFQGLSRYGVVYSYQTAETSDFRKVFERLYGVSLERFFHDWTSRKGHPKLTVKTIYQSEDKIVRLEIRQTQKDEPFRFPLTIELVGAGEKSQTVTISPNIDKAEQIFLIPVKNRPTLIRVDPKLTLLAELKEEKSADWWKKQLTNGPTIAERIRAVEHFAKSQNPADRLLLVNCLKNDPFYGVRVEAASALVKIPKPIARDALLAGLNQKHPKVRRACVAALSKFRADAKVIRLLTAKQKQGDASYFVEAAVLETMTAVQKTTNLPMLKQALEKPSHREVIRRAAIKGLGKIKTPEALALLETWTDRGHPRRCRTMAIDILANSLNANKFSEKLKNQSLVKLAKHLSDSGPHIRRAAVGALTEIPDLAKTHQDAIAKLATTDADGRVRASAVSALNKFEEKQAATAKQNKKIRDELNDLKKRYKQLQEQLKKNEKKAAKKSSAKK